MSDWERGVDEDWQSYRKRLEREVRFSVSGKHLQLVNDKERKINDRWLDDIQKPLERGNDKKLDKLNEKMNRDLAKLYRNALKDKEFREGLPWGCRKLIGATIVTTLLVLCLLLIPLA